MSGPDGAVYVSDWCDLGECHDHDGTHRSSGRIYRAVYGKPKPVKPFDLRKKSDAELIRLLLHENDWYSRRARLLLAERAAARSPMDAVHRELRRIVNEFVFQRDRLQALWALYVTGGAPPAWLLSQTSHKEEHVRAWALRLLCESGTKGLADALEKAASDPSGLVRLAAASGLERLTHKDRLRVASRLVSHAEDAGDRCQPLLIWYGIESAVAAHPEEGVKLALHSKMPKLRQFIARRLSDGGRAASLETIVRGLEGTVPVESRRDLLQGMRDGLKGIRKVDVPAGWKTAYADLAKSPSRDVRRLAALLAVQFEDRSVIDRLQAQLVETKADPADRVLALQALVEKGIDIAPQLFKLLDEPALRGPALRSLAAYKNDDTPRQILRVYPRLSDAEKQDAISTLASRPLYALALLDAVEHKKLPRADVTPFTARQLLDLKSKDVTARLEKVWGTLRKTPGEKQALIDRYKKMLTPDVLAKADLPKGRALFNKTCAQCHKLFGEGHSIGPELTGSDRANLHYVLENSVDPSAVIGSDYRLTNIVTSKGRLVAGIVVEETERALTVQTATERIVLPKDEIEERKQSNVSMMPEGQLEKLSPDELRDLVGYLASKTQVPLP
jgi:putative heme-binding domain-containing protein